MKTRYAIKIYKWSHTPEPYVAIFPLLICPAEEHKWRSIPITEFHRMIDEGNEDAIGALTRYAGKIMTQ